MKPFIRNNILQNMQSRYFDVLIIGGGITGAGIALDAASRGLKTALVEKNDFGSGTSSKSTKLIHGGLKYIPRFDFKLIKEVGQERKILLQNAPHLVFPKPMTLPIFNNNGLGKWSTIFGLWLYELLIKVKKHESFKVYNAFCAKEKEPLLKEFNLKGACVYTEYQTHDIKLVVDLIKTAHKLNASCLNYVVVNKLLKKNGVVSGANATDSLSGNNFSIKANLVINATGPWGDMFLKKTLSETKKTLSLSKGVHLVFSKKKLPLSDAICFPAQDGRLIFAIPRFHCVYVGTTDTLFNTTPENLVVEDSDIKYLLFAINNFFSKTHLSEKDILSSWAGLRPLVFNKKTPFSLLSRKDELFISKNGLITITGGKLTGYRIMAKKTIDLVYKKLNRPFVHCKTKNIPLVGADFTSPCSFFQYWKEKEEKILLLGGDKSLCSVLSTYGCQIDFILGQINRSNTFLSELKKAEFEFSKKYEGVTCFDDYKKRRTLSLFSFL